MAIEAQLADGRILEFPDGTDPAVIQSTVKRLLAPAEGAPVKSEPASSDFAFSDPMGGGDFSSIAEVKKPKTVMEKAVEQMPLPSPNTIVAPGIDRMIEPRFIKAVEAQLNAMPQEQRQVALQRLLQRGDVYGRAAKVVADRYKKLDALVTPTAKAAFDPRLEAQKERFIREGAPADLAEHLARVDASRGVIGRGVQSISPDVVGERADAEAAARAEELKDAGFFRRVGAEVSSEATKAGLGLINVFADITGDKNMQNIAADARRVEEARQGAIPKGASIFERSAQSAITSLATQTPMVALSILTGTSAPVLIQAGVQQFGNSYGEGRAAGLSAGDALTRALPMTAAEIFFERFGMEKALAGLKAFVDKNGYAAIPKYVAKAIATELPPEMATTATQYGIDILPEVGLKKNPSLLDLYKELEETLRQTVIQAGTQSGVVIAGAKGAEKLSSALQKLESQRYKRDTSYEGLSQLIAQSKGFLAPQVRRRAPETDFGGLGEFSPGQDAGTPPSAPPPSVDAEVEALTQRGVEAGLPEEDARVRAEAVIAERQARRAKEQEQKLAPRVEALTQEFIDAGVAPEQARALALEQAKQEAEADAIAESELSDVGGAPASEPAAGGEGVGVAGRPEPGAPAAGVGVTEPSGVAPAGRAVEGIAGGEATAPASVSLDDPLFQAQYRALSAEGNRLNAEEEAQGRVGVDNPLVAALKNVTNPLRADKESLLSAYQFGLENGRQDISGVAGTILQARFGVTPQPVGQLPKKRGRPAVLTPEQKAAKEQDRRTQRAVAMKADRAVNRLTSTLDKLAEPLDLEAIDSDEALAEAQAERTAQKREAIKELLQLQAAPNLRGTKVGERIKAALAHSSITPKELADLKAGLEAQRRAMGAAESVSRSGSGAGKYVADPAFAKFTNAAQALSYIIKNGTPFQKMLAKRLRGFVNGVTLTVVEAGQPLPNRLTPPRNRRAWDRARALFIENADTGNRAIFVRGASFGVDQGINAVTILHEILHAATNRKVTLAIEAIQRGASLNSPLVRSAQDLLRTMNSAIRRYNDMADSGQLSPELAAIARSGEALTDPREFISYGMTDEAFQNFLMTAKGFDEDTSFFTRFVRGIRDLFGMGDEDVNALSDLIRVTDSILTARAPRQGASSISAMFGIGKKKEPSSVTPDVPAEGGQTIQAKPSANVQRLAKMLGSKLYGTPKDIAVVSVKELFQNSFDAIKEAQELGAVQQGKVLIKADDKTRTITVVDNGLGMPTSVMGNQFLQIAGTVKGTKRASGGLGVAKMLFLFENKKLEVVSLRGGVLSRMVTTGDDLKAALEDSDRAPQITTSTDPKAIEQYTNTLFPEGHGTAVIVQIPESFEDPSTGEEVKIPFSTWDIKNAPVLRNSPLFDNIEVTVDTGYPTTLPIGTNFPAQDFTPFANVNFAWGTARIYVSKEKVDPDWSGNNTSVLSNGLWQFDTSIKAGTGYGAPAIKRKFYVDLSPAENVKPEDPGYPFELNRQNFSKAAGEDFAKIANYIATIYSQVDFGESVKNFGTVQYVNVDGTLTAPETLEPKVPPSDNAFTMIKPDDQVEVRDGVLYVNNRAMPELTPDDLKKASIQIDELTIPQGDIDPNRVMVHDNTTVPAPMATVDRLLAFSDTDQQRYLFDYTLDGKSGTMRIYDVSPDENGAPTRDGVLEVISGTPEEIEQQLVNRGLMEKPPEGGISLTDAARAQFGAERVNKYLAEIGQTFQLLRNALVARDPTMYDGLREEAVGVSVDVEYYGVNIRVPFRGMFINPATTSMHGNPMEVALSMIGTMIHELAHFKVRNHGAEFPSEMQRIMTLLETFPGIDLSQVKKNLEKHIAAHQDIFDFMNKEFKSGNLKPRGNRFKDGSYQQIGDEGAAEPVEGAGGAGEGRSGVPQGTGPSAPSAQPVGVPPGSTGKTSKTRKAAKAVATQEKVSSESKVVAEKYKQSDAGQEYAKGLSALQMMQVPGEVADWLRDYWDTFTNGARKAMSYLVPTDFTVEVFGDAVPELKNTSRLLQKMRGMSMNLLKSAGKLADDMDRAFRKDKTLHKKLNQITAESTLLEIDPSDPKATKRDARLDRMWRELGAEGQSLYVRIRDHFTVLSDYFGQLLDAQITESNLPIAEKANLLAKVRAMYETGAKIQPFFPLVRDGEYSLGIGSGKNRKFFMFKTMRERNRAMRRFADERIKQKPGESSEAFARRRRDNLRELLETEEYVIANSIAELRSKDGGTDAMLRDVFDAIDGMSFDGRAESDVLKAREELKDSVYQIYLRTLPDQSFRRQFIHRKGVTGFDPDILRSFSDATSRMAFQLARLKYGRLINNSISQARDSIRNRPEYESVIDAVQRRARRELNPSPPSVAERVAATATKASFIWYLGGASSALLQPLSVFQTGYPVLASKYGVARAGKELGRMLNLWNQYGYYQTNTDGSKSWVMPTVEHSRSLTPDERRAVKAMGDYNLTTNTYANEVFDYKETPRGNVSHPIVEFGKDTFDALVMGGLMHTTERISREMVYLAAYRLNRQAGKSHEESVLAAVDDTNEALFNYNKYNRPDFMTGAAGAFLTQFMSYVVFVTMFLVRNFIGMIKPMKGRTRTEAIKQFFGTMGTTYILGGYVALPGFNLVMSLLGVFWKMLTDEEEEDELKKVDFVAWFRLRFMQEQLGDTKIAGKSLADLAERGPVNAITGLDISSRTSLNNIWFRDTKETATVRDSAQEMALASAGPTVNMILSWAEAYEAFMQGDYAKGAKKMAPAGFRYALNAYEQATKGAETPTGKKIAGPDAFTLSDIAGQAVGFRPDKLAAAQYALFKVIGAKQEIENERTSLLRNLDREYRSRDMKAYAKVMKDIAEFNRKFPRRAITGDNIADSLEKRQTQRVESVGGITLTEEDIGLARAVLPSYRAIKEAERKGRGE